MSKIRQYNMYKTDIKIMNTLNDEDKLWFVIDKINKECITADSKYYMLKGYLKHINNNIIIILKLEFEKLINNSCNSINKVLFSSDYDLESILVWLIFQGEFFYKKNRYIFIRKIS